MVWSSSVPVTAWQFEFATRRAMSVAFGLWQVAHSSALPARFSPCSESCLWQSLHLLMSTTARYGTGAASVIANALPLDVTGTATVSRTPSPLVSMRTLGRPSSSALPEPVAAAGIATVAVALNAPGNAGSGTPFALKSMPIGCAGVPVVAVAEPLPVFVKSGRVENATSTRNEALPIWNGPPAALMSYGALLLVGSVTRIVTVGFWPGLLSATFSTSYLNFSPARSSGSKCTWSGRRPKFELGPWQVKHWSSVAATPPWPTPVSKLT